MLVFQIQLEFGRLFERKIGGLPACDPPRSILIAPTSVYRAGLCRTAVAGIVAYVARLFPTIGEGVETTLAALQLRLSYKAANNLRPSGPTRRSRRFMASSGVIDRSNAPASLLTPYRRSPIILRFLPQWYRIGYHSSAR